MAEPSDIYIDPTKLKPLPRTVVPDAVNASNMPAPEPFPALPWAITLGLLLIFPLTYSLVAYLKYGYQTCDRPVALYLLGQVLCSGIYLFLVGIPMWKRINWVGDLKDAIAEYPDLPMYNVGTMAWWFEFGWTVFGVRNAAEASACSDGLKRAARNLAGYMMGFGVWLDLLFHIVIPAMLHLYSGQAAAEIIPPGAMIPEPGVALPPKPPKRKRPPPKRECPRCKNDNVPDNLKLCQVCGQFVPPLQFFLEKKKVNKDGNEEGA